MGRGLQGRLFSGRRGGAGGGPAGRRATASGPDRAGQSGAEAGDGGRNRSPRVREASVSLWQGIVLGLVQGLTEFLPVSSSGHLVLVEALTGVHFTGVAVEVSLHVATLGSLLVLCGARLWGIGRGLLRGDGRSMRYAALLVVATIPAGVIGVLFHRQIEERFHSLTWIGDQFIITGMMLLATRWSRGDRDLPSLAAAVGIGFGQAFAILPAI